jgi:hypothetical protein
LLSSDNSAVRGAAAVAVARQTRDVAVIAVSAQLRREIASEQAIYKNHEKRGESQGLGSSDGQVADRADWVLVKNGTGSSSESAQSSRQREFVDSRAANPDRGLAG